MTNETLTCTEIKGGNWDQPMGGRCPISWLESWASPEAPVMVLHSNGVPVATVGMGATECFVTDRRAYTVISVSPSGKTAKVQADKATRTDSNGMSDCQTWEHAPDPDGSIHTIRLTKRGWMANGRRFYLGTRRTYHDFSF